jgi:ketosteroid isomerase-like protein
LSYTQLPRRAALVLAAAAMLTATPSWAAKAPAVPTEAEILAVLAKFLDAIQNAPTATIAPMMSEKLTYVHSNGGANDKATQLAVFTGQATPRWIKIENRDLTVKPYPGLAVITGEVLFTSVPPAGQTTAPTAKPYRYTTVWAKEDGVWRLVNFQIANIVQASPVH